MKEIIFYDGYEIGDIRSEDGVVWTGYTIAGEEIQYHTGDRRVAIAGLVEDYLSYPERED